MSPSSPARAVPPLTVTPSREPTVLPGPAEVTAQARPVAPPPVPSNDAANIYRTGTDIIDRLIHAWQGRLTMGLSPAAVTMAYLDWVVNLGQSVGKMTELGRNVATKSLPFVLHALRSAGGSDEPFISPLPQDSRFAGPEWQKYPFNMLSQSFLFAEQWWHYATTGVRGVTPHHEQVVSFAARQLLDMMAPSNFPATNPDVIRATLDQGGANLGRGAKTFFDDVERALTGKPPAAAEAFKVGRDVAVTPGKVVFRNRLIELIQYGASTPEVAAEPILIVPAWIMKYYILDLSPHNSLVRYLVDRGHTVFMVSWKNPLPDDRDLGMDDYRRLGIMAALDVIGSILPGRKTHAVGYCLGGTLLAIAAAAMARDADDRLKTVTLLAAQTDFEEAGEIMLFIDHNQVTFLEDMMWEQGLLDTKQMAGAFQLLRSNDLVWSRVVRQYLLGEPETMSDLMAWNADPTRMPYRMHTEYLRELFLDNNLGKGRFRVDGRPIALTDIRAPVCAVGTTKDHVAPWQSVYKIAILSDTDVTFILTTGGHNAGIVSEPGHPRRSFQMATRRDTDHYIDPDTWAQVAPRFQGSWWPAWQDWITHHGDGGRVPAPGPGSASYPPIGEAPGAYVLMR